MDLCTTARIQILPDISCQAARGFKVAGDLIIGLHDILIMFLCSRLNPGKTCPQKTL